MWLKHRASGSEGPHSWIETQLFRNLQEKMIPVFNTQNPSFSFKQRNVGRRKGDGLISNSHGCLTKAAGVPPALLPGHEQTAEFSRSATGPSSCWERTESG